MSAKFSFDPVTGQVEDLIVHRRKGNRSLVGLGKRFIGEIHGPDSLDGYTAISHAQPPRLLGLRMVSGFRTRWQAVEYLLNVGVRLPQNRCVPELGHHPEGYHGMLEPNKCWE